MKKRIMALALTFVMMLSVCVNASAATGEPQNFDEAIAMGYDDFLVDQVTRGYNPPSASKLWNFDDGDYEGHVTKIRTGVYTNYCFYPNSKGTLYVTTNLSRLGDVEFQYYDWKIEVSAYNMSGQYIEKTKTGDLHRDNSLYKDELTFTGLTSNTKYCFFIKVYNDACQVSGDVIVSR